MFAKDLYDFISLLNKHNAEYLIVGGYAVGNYGYPRATGDLDVWLNPIKENYSKIKKVVAEFGFPESGSDISGVTFPEAHKNKTEKTIEGLKICYIGYDDLIKNKIASGRPKDILDVKYFEKMKNKI